MTMLDVGDQVSGSNKPGPLCVIEQANVTHLLQGRWIVASMANPYKKADIS